MSHPSINPLYHVANAVPDSLACRSDISYAAVAALAARVRSAGASLLLLGGRDGMLASTKPVVAVTAVRTGCGKSQVCLLCFWCVFLWGSRGRG